MECHQPSGSFKIRGIGHLCTERASAGYRHFVIASGGNAGLAVAYAGQQLAVPVTVVLPKSTKAMMKKKIEDMGATVEVIGENWNAAHGHAIELAQADDSCYIHPFDHPLLWQGHASLIEEAAEQMEEPDAIVVSVGGGGLFSGVMEGLEQVAWNTTKVIAVETKGADSLHYALEQGQLTSLNEINSIATSLGAKQVCDQAWEWAQQERVTSVVVPDAHAVLAMRYFLDEYQVLVEPACGAALAAVYVNTPVLQEHQRILVIVCGGAGVDLSHLQTLMVSYM